ncbi:hypothetical protein BH11ACT4_BH11ACT4_22510 [soil metagenome]
MIEWFTGAQVVVAVVAGLLCLVLGLAGRKPNDYTLGATALVEVLLVVQLVMSIVAPFVGGHPTGSLLEYWVYLVSAVLVPAAAVFWALVDRSRWSTVVLAVACFAIAVMVYRMGQIWFVQAA